MFNSRSGRNASRSNSASYSFSSSFSVEEQKVYDIHVLMAPEGYAPDDGVYNTLDTFSDVNIFLEKAA